MIALHRALNQPRNDIIAIAIETGIQNTGMSIFILWFTLDHPLGDITGESISKNAIANMCFVQLSLVKIVNSLIVENETIRCNQEIFVHVM